MPLIKKAGANKRPYWLACLTVLGIFMLLVVRNWPVFNLTDMYDGMSFKMIIVSDGINLESFRKYIEDFAIGGFNQHFIPVWFLLFYAISVVTDNHPLILGLLNFGVASLLLYFMFKILRALSPRNQKGALATLIITLFFSSTIFFLEMLAWKWMLSLLLSTAAFYFCLFIIMKEKKSMLWKFIYILSMLISMWTFGLGWLWAWGLVLCIQFSKTKKNSLLLTTMAVALGGSLCVFLVNKGLAGDVDVWSLISTFPSATAMITANLALSLIGIFRFTDSGLTYVSTTIGITAFLITGLYYFRRHRNGKFNNRDALTCSLLIIYVASIFFSLLRIAPNHNHLNTSINTYLFGNRYLFAYAVPLTLALGVMIIPYMVRLSRASLFIMAGSALLLGFIMRATYPNAETVITNKARNTFYNLTPAALDEAQRRNIVLPNLNSDLLFAGGQVDLSEAIYIRKNSLKTQPTFKQERELTKNQCQLLKNNQLINTWLSAYKPRWCSG